MYCYYHGPIPSIIGNLTGLSYLLLNSNNLTGQIPSSICNLSSLEALHLSENKLQGRIPQCLGNFSTSLRVLALKDNQLDGPIPTTFADCNELEYINMNANNLHGPLPQSLGKCRHLQVLDIGNNEIQDSFPNWTETLPELRVLVMKSNRFLGKLFSNNLKNDNILPFPKLQIFDISHNNFTGYLPDGYLKNLVAMENVKISGTEERKSLVDPVTLVLKGSARELVRISVTSTLIDFSNNQFYGSIPYSMGKLNSLIYLNFSHNMLEGKIPTSFGNLSALEQLDLSSNQLHGEIPLQLTQLTFLSSLNLSSNNLSGPIPTRGGQFQTFDNNSYMGNPELCGYPLTKKCRDFDKAQPISPREDDDSEFLDTFTWKAVVMGYGCGFIFGVILGCLALLHGRPAWLLNIFFGVRRKI
ncbi:hypothetical protein CDL12_10765 [Handroanthus impetiginosus]|uniref:Leucine-rich repeat protein n=1 Tax=Handroanthus impetiginosus TaxID=429701 RepID=A0A2G9HGE3_9LAMI|nr:hypothetical protein CDL12_10765 [Handroanthus impetiginosus]